MIKGEVRPSKKYQFNTVSMTSETLFEYEVSCLLNEGWKLITSGLEYHEKWEMVLYWAFFTKEVIS